ncbi:MAG: tyrosine-type recombinase/integrase [Bdellovibrionales bacterium]|nr:tyrosine-type recombinase/integrase [Bdellovibrionales bacterium]
MALDYWVEFFEDLQWVRGRSRNTVQAYRRDLEIFEEFKKEGYRDISEFYEFLQKRNLSKRSQARIVSSLRTYFKFLESKGEKVAELQKLRPPKVNNRLPQPLTLDQFRKLLEACQVESPAKSQRNRLTLFLLFGLGCRVTELIGLKLSDFSETESWLSVEGKGGKQRLVPLTDQLQSELKDYLEHARPALKKEITTSILINDRGKQPSRVDIWRWLAAWSARAGFPSPISPHQFRHGCATTLLENGADLRSIQMLLGHSSIQTTQIYTSVTAHKIKEEIEKNHPLSGLKDLTDL